ncbi:potassium transporter, putative [Medicago truncatula]|uniref:Potassium transporter, putative n=1 Tax=Medicago truncatula TaxID=3880 RepID=A0A072V7S4_MEDTR|nr:potassium transporter, putative [Medicago truncatula]
MEGCSDSEYSKCEPQTEQSRDFILNNNGNTTSLRNKDYSISSVDSIVPARSPTNVNVTFQSSNSHNTEVDELEFLNN